MSDSEVQKVIVIFFKGDLSIPQKLSFFLVVHLSTRAGEMLSVPTHRAFLLEGGESRSVVSSLNL